MKKFVFGYSIFWAILILMATVVSCGANWDVKRKEGLLYDKYLNREILVYNDFTGELEFEYRGVGYVQMRNDGACINVTILDKESNKKIDVIGSGVHIISMTVEDSEDE